MIISILFIVIAHKIYGFFISQFTTPKVNDFVNKPNEEYMKILETSRSANHKNDEGVNQDETPEDSCDPEMKATLKNFLKDIADQPSFSNSATQSFSSYEGGASFQMSSPSPF